MPPVAAVRALGPVTAGLVKALWGGYAPVLRLLTAVAVAAAVAAVLIEPRRSGTR